jgi:VanZ family protein
MMFKHFVPAFLWLLFISGLSVMPGVQLPSISLFTTDKLAHAVVYGVLMFLILSGFAKARSRRPGLREGLLALLVAGGYGVLMEFVQYKFIPGRFYEVDDMLANLSGAAAAWAGSFVWYRKNP